jgi:ABC-type transport system substrate-binding protein
MRQAFSSASDRQTWISTVVDGPQLRALTFAAPGLHGHVDGVAQEIGHPYDLTVAQQLLTQAGRSVSEMTTPSRHTSRAKTLPPETRMGHQV